MRKQSKIFLTKEGDNYFNRNKNKPFIKDNLFFEIKKYHSKKKIKKLIEIGCGQGHRLNLLNKELKINCYGIDPSSKAIKSNRNSNIIIKKGTADKVNFKSNYFDVVAFGFCLYLVDTNELHKVFSETQRIMKKNSLIFIYDFFSKDSKIFRYKHNLKIKVHKYDFSKIFTWHPDFTLIKTKKFYMNDKKTSNNILSISVIKKN